MGDQDGPTSLESGGGQMIEVNCSTDVDGGLPSLSIGPPSPLTGCYLLIVIGEPHSPEHKDIILQRLIKGKVIRFFFYPFNIPYIEKQNSICPFYTLFTILMTKRKKWGKKLFRLRLVAM